MARLGGTSTEIAGFPDAAQANGWTVVPSVAMVTESDDDGEGQLLESLRELLGPDTPIVVTLDLGGKSGPAMGGPPLELTGEVVDVSGGDFVLAGPTKPGRMGILVRRY